MKNKRVSLAPQWFLCKDGRNTWNLIESEVAVHLVCSSWCCFVRSPISSFDFFAPFRMACACTCTAWYFLFISKQHWTRVQISLSLSLSVSIYAWKYVRFVFRVWKWNNWAPHSAHVQCLFAFILLSSLRSASPLLPHWDPSIWIFFSSNLFVCLLFPFDWPYAHTNTLYSAAQFSLKFCP